MRKPRVAIDASPVLPPRGGAPFSGIQRTTSEFLRALADVDLPFDVVLFGQRLRGPSLASIGLPFPSRQIRLPRWHAIDVIKQRLPIVESFCRHDLFHSTANFASVCQPERVIATIHDAMFLAYPESFLGHGQEARRIPPFARRCRAIITCSQASRKDIVRLMDVDPAKVHVIPWGVDHNLFRPFPERAALRSLLNVRFGLERPYFLQVSCDIGRKNTPLLISAYEELLKHKPANDLVLIWRNPPIAVQARLANSELARRVHVIPYVEDEDLRLLYCGATAMAFPSAYEGFGLPILEAMACGTPVITTTAASLPEVGGDAAFYITTDDRGSLYSALAYFEDGHSFPIEKLTAHAARFTWPGYVNQIVPIYSRYLAD